MVLGSLPPLLFTRDGRYQLGVLYKAIPSHNSRVPAYWILSPHYIKVFFLESASFNLALLLDTHSLANPLTFEPLFQISSDEIYAVL